MNLCSPKFENILLERIQKQQSPEVFYKKAALKNVLIFTGKHLCWSLYLQVCNFIKKRLQHRCFTVNMPKFLKTPILKNICERVLLRIKDSFGKAFSQTSLKPNAMDISFSTRSLVDFKTKLCYARFTIYTFVF